MTKKERLDSFLKEVFDFRKERANQAENDVRSLCQNGTTSMAAAIAAVFAAWTAFSKRPQSESVSNSATHLNNLTVLSHLGWICNSAIAVRTMALTGFEPQAKVLTRSLLESIYQTLIIFHDPESYSMYAEGVDIETSKDAYYRAFAKKKRLHKKMQVLEDEFKELTAAERSEEFEQKIKILEFYSQATHGAASHIMTSSLQPSSSGNVEYTILGAYTLSTENTLINCAHEICYFGMLFEHIVHNVWRADGLENDEHFELFSDFIKLAAVFRTYDLPKSNE